MPESDYHAINSYGLIGDLHSAALVGATGSIDWCCLPVFDSASLFAAILDKQSGGSFAINLPHYDSHHFSYLTDTNILSNTMKTSTASIEILDYMPVLYADGHRGNIDQAYICRHIECKQGVNIKIEIFFDPKPNYGDSTVLRFSQHSVESADHSIQLISSHPVSWYSNGHGTITLSRGDSARLVLCYNDAGSNEPIELKQLERWSDKQIYNTRHYWEEWLNHSLYDGRWRRMVERSALTLKLLTYQPSGAILAAPTTSLPESLGGSRNWDYRFSWLRDSVLILDALLPLGFIEEAKAYVDWIVSKCPDSAEHIPILYSIGSIDNSIERELPQFEGYQRSSPVRVGNAAKDQTQLDVYGEIIDCLYIYCLYGHPLSDDIWDYINNLANRICQQWQQRDEGIWEVRNQKQHFTYSKLMCWVGLDRAIRIGQEQGFCSEFDYWLGEKERIHHFILSQCVDSTGQYLKQSRDNNAADASNLLAIIMGFLPPSHPIMINTVDETMKQLMVDNMVYRYLSDDGLDGHEGSFNICTFWLVEALTLIGRDQQAEEIFNQMLEHASNLGLYAEETDVQEGIALGNFPQAFSHLGLINAASVLNNQRKGTTGKPLM